jgi:predicted phage tail protein
MRLKYPILGSYGSGNKGDGASSGGGYSEDPDSLRSKSLIRLVDLICEGEVEGFIYRDEDGVLVKITEDNVADIGKCIFLDDVRLKNFDNTFNFSSPQIGYTLGTAAQLPLPIADNIESVVVLNRLVRHDDPSPPIYDVPSDPQLSEIIVTVRVEPLYSGDKDTGKIHGSRVEFDIYKQVDSGAWSLVRNCAITGKTRSFYERSYRVTMPVGYTSYSIKIARGTADSPDLTSQDSLYFKSVTSVVQTRLSYPHSALIAFSINSAVMNSVPRRAYQLRGTKVRMPANYYPEYSYTTGLASVSVNELVIGSGGATWGEEVVGMLFTFGSYSSVITEWLSATQLRIANNDAGIYIAPMAYSITAERFYATKGAGAPSGFWDGTGLDAGITQKVAWTDNPAWIFYDLCVEPRYGAGEFIAAANMDKWALYDIAQYCDGLVDDGKGGHEARFTCNCYLQERADAYEVFKNLASTFRGMLYWSRGTITAVQDRDYGTSCALFTRANVVDGRFTYRGTARRARHTVALVTWADPNDMYRRKVEYVEDADGIAELGVNQIEVSAFACSSQGQAHRVGKWLLLTELNETETVEFKAGIDSAFLRPGHIISVSDPLRSADRLGGRIVSVIEGSGYVDIGIDAPVTLAAGKTYKLYSINPVSDLKETTNSAQTTALNDVVMEATLVTSTSEVNQVNVPLLVLRIPSSPTTGCFVSLPNTANIWILACVDTIVPQSFRILAVSEPEDEQVSVIALEHVTSKYAAIEEGIALQEQPTFSLPNPLTVLPPSDVTVVAEYDVTELGLHRDLSITWTHSEDLFRDHYVVELQYENSNWAVVGQTDSNTLEVEVRFATSYSVRVRAVNTIGNSSTYATTSFDLSSTILADSAVTGLELFGQGNNTVFEGRDPKFVWRWNSLDTGGDVAFSASGFIHPLFKAFVVQILNTFGQVVREEFVTNATYTYTFEHNVEDNITPLREFTIRVAVIDKTNHLSLADELTVNNVPPKLGENAPIWDTDLIRKSARGGNLILNYDPPEDLDFEGVLVFASKTAATVLASNLLKADGVTLKDIALAPFDSDLVLGNSGFDGGLLAYRGSNTTIVLPLLASTYYITVAPYDAFGVTGLNLYELGSSVISSVVDTTPPSNTVITPVLSSAIDGAGVKMTATLTLSDTDEDLGSITWGLRKKNGPYAEAFGTVVARDEDGLLITVIIEWQVEAVTAYEVRFAAIDTSGNQADWTSLYNHTTVGDSTAPSKPTSVQVAGSVQTVFLSWVNPTDADLSHIVIYEQDGGVTPVAANWALRGSPITVYGSAAALAGRITGHTYYYWLCAVDYSGNPNPIIEASCSSYVTLALGSLGVNNLALSELSAYLGNAIILSEEVFTNNSPSSGYVAWNAHKLYYQGSTYNISSGSSNLANIYWTIGGTTYAGSASNLSSDSTKVIIVTNAAGTHTKVWFYVANAAFGSVWIKDALILNAMIGTITADKIKSGVIQVATIELAASVSTGTYIKAGLATAFNTGSGIWLGIAPGGIAQFRIGDPAGAYLAWDSAPATAGLTLKGYLKIGTSSSLLQGSAPSTAGLYLGADKMGFNDGSNWKTWFNSAGDFAINSGGNAVGEGEVSWSHTSKELVVYGTLKTTRGISVIGGLQVVKGSGSSGQMYWATSGSAAFATSNTPYYFEIQGLTGNTLYFSLGEHFTFAQEVGTITCKIGNFNVYALNAPADLGYYGKMYWGTGTYNSADTQFFLGSYRYGASQYFQFSLGDRVTFDSRTGIFQIKNTGSATDYVLLNGSGKVEIRSQGADCLIVGTGSNIFGVTFTGSAATSGIWLGAASFAAAQADGKFTVDCNGNLGANVINAAEIIADNIITRNKLAPNVLSIQLVESPVSQTTGYKTSGTYSFVFGGVTTQIFDQSGEPGTVEYGFRIVLTNAYATSGTVTYKWQIERSIASGSWGIIASGSDSITVLVGSPSAYESQIATLTPISLGTDPSNTRIRLNVYEITVSSSGSGINTTIDSVTLVTTQQVPF